MRIRRTPTPEQSRSTQLPPLSKRDTSVPMSAEDFAKTQRKRWIRPAAITVVAIVPVLVLTWWLTDLSQARAFRADGEALYHSGRYGEAIASLTTAISKRPSDADAYRLRARAYLALNQNDSAISDLDRVVDLRPKDAEALGSRGLILITSRGCSQDAVQDLSRALEIAPSAEWYARRGACLLTLKRPAEAVADLTRAMELDPASDHYLDRASAYSAVGDHAKAIADVDRAIERNPNRPDAFSLRAAEKAKIGDSKGAEEDQIRFRQLDAASALRQKR